MARRVWDDVWPRFKTMLGRLEKSDAENALTRRVRGAGSAPYAYAVSTRIYGAMLRTMSAVVGGVEIRDDIAWEMTLAFRRFLDVGETQELQSTARTLYSALRRNNADAVWLALSSTIGTDVYGTTKDIAFPPPLHKDWTIRTNAEQIMA